MTTKGTEATSQEKNDRWYLHIMSPNTKGEKFAWLDPTSIYINGEAFHDLLNDLVTDLKTVKCDVVAGLDAMGFVLGSALATKRCLRVMLPAVVDIRARTRQRVSADQRL